ncbi:MAG: hypothetical protein KIT19_07630 [Phycisphaeraceae bacterium]|nr:hypothetical protein [Phycisphaeraceae bacterium]
MSRRVVITGIGLVTGYGIGKDAAWAGLCSGATAITPIDTFDASGFSCRLGAQVKNFSAKDFVPKHYRKAVKVMARDIEIAVGAAHIAVADAGLITRAALGEDAQSGMTYPSERMGCHIGAGLISAETPELAAALSTSKSADGEVDIRQWGATGMNNLPPLWMLKYLPNMLACHVTILHGCEGPSNTITCQDASGLLSIGESARVIERDAADLCFSGGAESRISMMGMSRMIVSGRLADAPHDADPLVFARPYDDASPGGLPGEAGGILILEEESAAASRGAKMHARLLGFGAAQSGPPSVPPLAKDQTIPSDGLRYAIEAALDSARCTPEEIDAIFPLAACVPWMDRAEGEALREVFGDRLASIELATLSPQLGQNLAGDGAVRVGIAAMCIEQQLLPARLHSGKASVGLHAGPAPARAAQLRKVLVCTSSNGGQNAALVLGAV